MKSIEIHPIKTLGGGGVASLPGDKSISHRALMFASLAQGQSVIDNLLEGHDCMATLQVMRSLGVHIALDKKSWIVNGRGKTGLTEPSSILDCKNSGTTIRLMAGLLSAMPFLSVLDGTEQIKTRPMDRVIEPLRKMGAHVYGRGGDRLAPLVTLPSRLSGITEALFIKSAQVKSALILAALFADKVSRITNTKASRDHTERLLSFMGADIKTEEDAVVVSPLHGELKPISLNVPGDISSAAFLLVLGVLRAQNGITLQQVGINPTRVGIIDALQMMGAKIVISNEKSAANEPVADIYIEKSELRGQIFSGDLIVRMIDEIPVLALAATQAMGRTVIRDAHELKVKETNRISRTAETLRALGASIEETDDGLIIDGPTNLVGGVVSSFLDHRLALCASIAGLISKRPVVVNNVEVTDDSFPGFFETLKALGAVVKEFL